MTFALQKFLESKRAFRRGLAARPIAEKLWLLDALRERELAIRGEKLPKLLDCPSIPDQRRRNELNEVLAA